MSPYSQLLSSPHPPFFPSPFWNSWIIWKILTVLLWQDFASAFHNASAKKDHRNPTPLHQCCVSFCIVHLIKCNLKTPDNQSVQTLSQSFSTWVESKRANSTAAISHLPLIERWVAVVALCPEPSSLGSCSDTFGRCSSFSGFVVGNCKQQSRTESEISFIRVDLNVFSSNKANACVHLAVASLRALVKGISRLFLPKQFLLLEWKDLLPFLLSSFSQNFG